MATLPRSTKIRVPPVKSQGIKTKIVPLIMSSIRWDGAGRWIEPFLGSGVVALNVQPERALLTDTNSYIIRLYEGIQRGEITAHSVKAYLQKEGALLLDKGEAHFYEVRERFNSEGSPLDFLFLNRSCFNGMIRFSKKGRFNVPFCRKPDRFRQAYITKICNQIAWVQSVIKGKDWTFRVSDWGDTLKEIHPEDFVYIDPPYVGRHTDYYNNWTDDDADNLAITLRSMEAGFAYSMWLENKYRRNDHLLRWFGDYPMFTFSHFYHVGPTESLRNEMQEALVVSAAHACPIETSKKLLGGFEVVEEERDDSDELQGALAL